MTYSENQFQIALVALLKYKGYFVFHIPNQENRGGARHGAMLKLMGVMAGVPDLCIILDNGKSVWIELKTKSKQSKSQLEFENNLKLLGHSYIVVYDNPSSIANMLDILAGYGKEKK